VAVKQGWDRPDRASECCKAGCHNFRGTTRDGIASVHCQWHTDEWQMRLDAITQAHPVPEAVFAPPPPPVRQTAAAVAIPAGPLTDAQACTRCHQAPRDWPDSLCEDCRRG
jgi:hypothetical protein